MMDDKQIELLEMADQQLTGFASCRSTGSAVVLVEAMGLKKAEWEELKKQGRTRLEGNDFRFVDEYFGKH